MAEGMGLTSNLLHRIADSVPNSQSNTLNRKGKGRAVRLRGRTPYRRARDYRFPAMAECAAALGSSRWSGHSCPWLPAFAVPKRVERSPPAISMCRRVRLFNP